MYTQSKYSPPNDSGKSAANGAPQAYPEYAAKAKSHNTTADGWSVFPQIVHKDDYNPIVKAAPDTEINALCSPVGKCGSRVLVGAKNGQYFFKRLYCSQEFCKTCFKNGSVSHRRRQGRWFNKWLSMDYGWHYMVFTIPVHIRKYIGKEELNYLTDYVKRKVQRDYNNPKGFTRWHFGGDKDGGYNYKPHINVVFDHTFMKPKEEKAFKKGWRKALFQVWRSSAAKQGITITARQYSTIAPGMWHRYIDKKNKNYLPRALFLLRYVTRATYRGKDDEVRKILYKFRNARSFGFTKDNVEKHDADNEALTALKTVNWNTGIKLRFWEFLELGESNQLEYLGLGLWKTADPEPT